MNDRDKGDRIDFFPENYIVIDIETTGFDPAVDDIIEIGAIKYNGSVQKDVFSAFVNINKPLDPFIVNLTGITDDMLSTADTLDNVMGRFIDFIGEEIIVGHNVHFDVNFLYDATVKCLGRPLQNDFVDTLYLSKKYLPGIDSHKLSILCNHYNLDIKEFHRANEDCVATNGLLKCLKAESQKHLISNSDLLNNFDPKSDLFNNKLIAFVGAMHFYDHRFIALLCEKINSKADFYFNRNADILVFSNNKYKNLMNPDYSSRHIDKARTLQNDNSLDIYSETGFYKKIGIPISESKKSNRKIDIEKIIPDTENIDSANPIFDKVVVFTGTLSKMSRKDAMQLVVNCGGELGNSVTKKTNFLVLGNNDYCRAIKDGKSAKQKKAESLILEGRDLQIISENVFYDMVLD